MKKLSSLLVIILLFAAFPGKTAAYGLEWRVDFTTNHRLRLKDDNEFSHVEYRLDLRPEAKFGRSSFTGELRLNSPGLPVVEDSTDLTRLDSISPWGLEIREAYVD